MAFLIEPHVRLQEWVADELGFFRDEGLDYVFKTDGFAAGTSLAGTSLAGTSLAGSSLAGSVTPATSAPLEVRSGAFEDMGAGRAADVSCACHWAVNEASRAEYGKMYGRAYSVCPSAIFVAPDSPCRAPADLAGVKVGVGYHSGSHYSAVQALEPFLERDQITMDFVGRPFDRVRLMLDGKAEAVNAWGASAYILAQRGFRQIVDSTFALGFLVSPRAGQEDVQRYFRGLLRAQREIDVAPEPYKHYWLAEIPEDLRGLADVRQFGPGERVVAQPYTREMFERTHRWMVAADLGDVALDTRFEDAVLA